MMGAGVIRPSAFFPGSAHALEAHRQSDLKRVSTALEAYRRSHGLYPETSGRWQGDMRAQGSYGYDERGYIPDLVPEFLPKLPKDPDAKLPDRRRGYMYRSDGINYKFVLLGMLPERAADDPFLDPVRSDSWQVSSPGARLW